MVDDVEADGRPSATLRVAFEVDDGLRTTTEHMDAGAELVAAPRETPWRSLNSRLHGPAGVELTVLQELEDVEDRTARPGFAKP